MVEHFDEQLDELQVCELAVVDVDADGYEQGLEPAVHDLVVAELVSARLPR